MQWHTGQAGSLAGEEQTPPNGVSVSSLTPRAQDICWECIVANIIHHVPEISVEKLLRWILFSVPKISVLRMYCGEYYVLLFQCCPGGALCWPVHKLPPICAGMSETLNKKQFMNDLENPNLVESESITPADPAHPRDQRFSRWCGRNLISHKLVKC